MITKAGKKLGVVQVYQLAPHYADLALFFALPKYRGQGVGTAVMQKLKKWLKTKKIKVLRIEIEKDNQSSKSFFKKMGAKLKSHIFTIKI